MPKISYFSNLMTTRQITLVKNSWGEMLILQQDPGVCFYNKLFSIDPWLRPLFKANITDQARKFIDMITYITLKLDKFDEVLQDAIDLGKRHRQYNVPNGSYETVKTALLATLEENLPDHWNAELEEAWKLAYEKLTSAMRTGEKD